MENIYSYVADNVKRVQDEINEVCVKYGRNPEDVILMGVSKTQPVEKLEVAYNAGIKLFGENRVQELVRKADFFRSHNVPCHIIGTLQTNKVKYLPELTDTIQSVNSLKLANEIEKQYVKPAKKPISVWKSISATKTAKAAYLTARQWNLLTSFQNIKTLQ